MFSRTDWHWSLRAKEAMLDSSKRHPMSKKKTPQEKKEAAYEKDHYTFAWRSPHGFKKSWKKKKNRVNRVVRRKSKALLHSIDGLGYNELSPEQESFTERLFRKGLSKRKLRKTGVVSLREKVEQKITDRRDHSGFNVRNKAREIEGFRRYCSNLVQEKNYSEKNLLQLSRLAGFPDFQEFLQSEPHWVPRLEQWILSASKRISWERKKQKQRISKEKSTPTRA